MKFNCPKCSTPQVLADTALPAGQTARVVCSNCSHAMTVRRPPAGAPPAASEPFSLGSSTAPMAIPSPTPHKPPPQATKPPLAVPPPAAPAAKQTAAGTPPPVDSRPASPFDSVGPDPKVAPDASTAAVRAAAVAAQGLSPDGLYDGSGDAGGEDGEGGDDVDIDGGGDSDPFGGGGGGGGGGGEPAYVNAAPGQATSLFMQTAGIYRRRRNLRIAGWVGGGITALIVAILAADVTGLIELPFLGVVYDAAGFSDPNLHRAIERTQSQLADTSLSATEREQLRGKLLGLSDEADPAPAAHGHHGTRVADAPQPAAEVKPLATKDHAMASEVFSKMDKHDGAVGGMAGDEAAVAGPLSTDTITKIIAENSKSLSMCYAEASRKARPPAGKLEIRLTISAAGEVTDVKVVTEKYRNTPMGRCAFRRVKGWKFPRSTGNPVTIAFPYLLTNDL